jgi:hypothetical protein
MESIGNPPLVWAKKELGFDETDILANRAGRYSDKQRIRESRGGTNLFLFSIFAIIILLLVLIFSDPNQGDPIYWLDVIIKGGLFTILLSIFAYMGWRTRKAAQNGIVRSASGIVTSQIEKKKVFINCGEVKLEVDKTVMELFPKDKEFIFYYSDIDRTVLSIEEK